MGEQDIILDEIVSESLARPDSLKKRWVYKFFANTVGFAMSFITQAIIPRALGPAAYGNFSFLSSFFLQAVSFFDMGTSTCFYTRISQRPIERDMVSFYLYYAVFLVLGMVAFVSGAVFVGFWAALWPGQSVLYIYLGAGFGILSWLVQILNNMADAYGITVSSEKIKILQKALAAFAIAVLYIFFRIDLFSFFMYQYAVLIFLICAFVYVIRKKGYLAGQKIILAAGKIRQYLKEFYEYSHPLFVYSVLGVFVNIFDRWLLQVFGGSVQQGFFGFAYQICALCFLFAGALTPLLIREFSISYAKKDTHEMGRIFRRYMPLILFITSALACFVASQSGAIIEIMGGEKYKSSYWPVLIMAFYPIYQVYGQVCASIFLATDKTRLYCSLGMVFMLAGLLATYLAVAPKTLFGMGGGAIGLAIKTMVMQALSVNALLFYSTRLLELPFRKYVTEQITGIASLFGLAVGGSYLMHLLKHFVPLRALESFLIAGAIYAVTVAIVLYRVPALFGLEKSDVDAALGAVAKYVRRTSR